MSNVCHITNKVTELSAVISNNKSTINLIVESWLTDDVPNSFINIGDNYLIFRLDRPTPGGGVLAYIDKSVPVSRLPNLEEAGKEVLWLLLKPHRSPRPFSAIIVVTVYYPPGQSVEKEHEMISYLTDGLDKVLHSRPSTGIIIAGDFNKLNLRRLCNRFNLKKMVSTPTRGNNILDQILTNMADLYLPAKHLPPLGRSDHQCLLLSPLNVNKLPPTSKKVRLHKPENKQTLSRTVALQNWDNVLMATDVDDKVEAFNRTILSLLDKAMPEVTIRMHTSDKPWITPKIKAQINARQKAYCRGDKSKYDQLCKKVSKLIRNAKQSFYHTEGRDLRQKDPAKWYKTVYTLLGAETNHNSLQTPSNEDLSKVAENLQTAFTNPWKDINVDLPDINEVNHLLKDTSPPLPSLGQVRSCLKHLNPKKATGIDKIPAWFLKHYCDDLTPAIHSIVTGSITQSKYPTAYKHAIVTPVPKIHQPKDINNDFRQISVLPHLAKMIEKIQLELNSHDLAIKDNQHAFVKNRSTVSALISMTQKWFDVTDNSNIGRKGVHTTFLDFKKAFDLVDHRILLIKLAEMNVSKAFWSWVKCFLTERTQHVNLHGVISSSAPCPAGVPQGSVISPTLFNIHINDLENTLTNNFTNTHKYADDCTLDEVVANGALSNMQESTNQVMNWANDNKMMVNPKKTKDMWISFSQSSPEPPPIQTDGIEIERVNSFKLLGVWVQNDLKWNTHVCKITKRANKLLFLLRECRKSFLPPEIGLLTYTSKIRPILEYASPVWGGIPKYLEVEIERVQQRSLRILGLEKDTLPTLKERSLGLEKDTLPTLKERRDKATCNELKRIVEVPNNPCNRFLSGNKNHTYELRRTRDSTPRQLSKTHRHSTSFIPRACRLTNS